MRFYKKGETLSYEGDSAKTLFVLQSGKIGIFKHNKLITEISESGSIIGELALILNQERSASIIALEDSAVLEIKVTAEDLVIKYPEVTLQILRNLAKRLVKTTNELANKNN